jgi:hypothetical protein
MSDETRMSADALAAAKARVERKAQAWQSYVNAMNDKTVSIEKLYDTERAYENAQRALAADVSALLAHVSVLTALVGDMADYIGKDWYYAPNGLEQRAADVLGRALSPYATPTDLRRERDRTHG